MTGYLCATPLHVINAVNLKNTEHRDEAGDLFLLNHFPDAPRLAKQLKESGLFRTVELIDENMYTAKGKLKKLFRGFFPAKALRRAANRFDYDSFTFFAIDFLNASYLIRKSGKRSCVFRYGEDGLGSYMSPTLYTPSTRARLIMALTGRSAYIDRIREMYLYAPELRVTNLNFQAKRIPPLNFSDPQWTALMEQLWPMEGAVDPNRNILYFEEPLREAFHTDVTALLDTVVNTVTACGKRDQMYIKKHPRMMADETYADLRLKCDAPFERIMGLWENDRSVLISVMCTAVVQPTVLCGNHPKIIVLYPMVLDRNHPLYRSCDVFFRKFKEQFGENVTLILPETPEEFETCLNDLFTETD